MKILSFAHRGMRLGCRAGVTPSWMQPVVHNSFTAASQVRTRHCVCNDLRLTLLCLRPGFLRIFCEQS